MPTIYKKSKFLPIKETILNLVCEPSFPRETNSINKAHLYVSDLEILQISTQVHRLLKMKPIWNVLWIFKMSK